MSSIVSIRVVGRAIVGTIVCLAALACFGLSVALHHDTLVKGWIPIVITAVIGIGTSFIGWKLWIWLTDSRNVWINGIAHAILVTGMLLAAFYSINYWGRNTVTAHIEQVEVTSRYYKIHHHTERSGRRSYSRGAPYKVYFIKVRFPDGRTKDIQLPYSEYYRLRTGAAIDMELASGFFGIPVISDLRLSHPASSSHRRHR